MANGSSRGGWVIGGSTKSQYRLGQGLFNWFSSVTTPQRWERHLSCDILAIVFLDFRYLNLLLGKAWHQFNWNPHPKTRSSIFGPQKTSMFRIEIPMWFATCNDSEVGTPIEFDTRLSDTLLSLCQAIRYRVGGDLWVFFPETNSEFAAENKNGTQKRKGCKSSNKNQFSANIC